jgi:sugar lactone lactonase YvrE
MPAPPRLTADPLELPGAHHGEGPVWDAAAERLLWVDLVEGLVLAWSPDGRGLDEHRLGREVGAVAPRSGGGLVAAVREGFATLDGDGRERVVAAPLADSPDLRMNDGAVDPQGRFWAGSMAYDSRRGAGALYRLDPDGTLEEVLSGVTISNGIDWDPSGRWCYYVDSPERRVDRFAFDAERGQLGERTTAVDLADVPGMPDGLTVDADGCIWVAIWDGGQVRRHAPDGRLLAVVELPLDRPTSCAFGGPALDRLYVTTSRFRLTADQLSAQPHAGKLFCLDPGTAGKASMPFRG